MPKFIYVPDKLRIDRGQYINVTDIHFIKHQDNGQLEVVYSIPGCPTTNKVIASREELAKTYSLDEVC